MTTGLIKSIKYKRRLYKKYINKPTEQNKQKYTTYRNKLTTLLKEAKSKYYKDKFDHGKHDVKKTWKIIKLTLNNKTQSLNTRVDKLMIPMRSLIYLIVTSLTLAHH